MQTAQVLHLPASYPFINRMAFILATRVASNAAFGNTPDSDTKAALRLLHDTLPSAMPDIDRVMDTVKRPRPLKEETVVTRALKTGADPTHIRDQFIRTNEEIARRIAAHEPEIRAVVDSTLKCKGDFGDPLTALAPLIKKSASYAIGVHARRIANGNADSGESDVLFELNNIANTGSL